MNSRNMERRMKRPIGASGGERKVTKEDTGMVMTDDGVEDWSGHYGWDWVGNGSSCGCGYFQGGCAGGYGCGNEGG